VATRSRLLIDPLYIDCGTLARDHQKRLFLFSICTGGRIHVDSITKLELKSLYLHKKRENGRDGSCTTPPFCFKSRHWELLQTPALFNKLCISCGAGYFAASFVASRMGQLALRIFWIREESQSSLFWVEPIWLVQS